MIEKRVPLPFKAVFQTLWPTLRPFLPWFLLGSVLILISTAIETVLPLLMGQIVEKTLPGSQNFAYLRNICALFLSLIVLKSVIGAIQAYVIQKAGQGISHELRTALFEKIASLEVQYLDKNPTGRLLTRVINDIKSLSELFTASISVLALDVLVIIGTIIAMLMLHPKFGVIVLAPFPFVVWTILYFGNAQANAYREVRRHLSEINGFLGENIAGIPTIQRLSAERSRSFSFSKISQRHFDAQNKSLRLFALVQPYANILNGVAMALVIGVGGYFVYRGEISLGIVIAYLGYLRNLFQPVRDLVEKYNTFLSAYVSSERVVRILNEKSEDYQDPAVSGSSPSRLSIEFKAVSFKYPNRAAHALERVSFNLEEGTSLAIVGATGSGKSSIVRLLLRFYEPSAGEISIGGRSITEWNRKELRSQFGMIHQEVFLFADTLRENLTVGRSGLKDDDLIRYCKVAQLWDLVSERGGLNFKIFEGGSNLSLGEKQLVNFARILALDPRVLIFDEATSSIDRILEEKVLRALSEVLVGRTTIAIAHRLSTIQSCDQIVVLEKGTIVESGKYDELKRSKGPFQKFYEIYANA